MTATASNANAYAQQIAAFNQATQSRNYTLPGQTRSSTNLLLRFDIPPSFLVARIKLEIRGTINAAPGTTPDPMGMSKMVNYIRLQSNMGDDLIYLTGPQYFGLFAPFQDFPGNVIPHSTGWAAIANGAAVVLPIILPLAVNLRDVTGLLPAQNRQTVLTLWVNLETDANLGTGTTITWTTQPVVTPTFDVFTIPFQPTAQPPISMIHRIIGLGQSVSGAGDFVHTWDRGNIVLQKIHGLGYQVTSPADHWSKLTLKQQQTDSRYVFDPNAMDTYVGYQRLQTRRKGVMALDLVGQSGLGIYDIPRDANDMRRFTDIQSVIAATGGAYPENCDTVTRYLQPI
jgi:hypothetical protein